MPLQTTWGLFYTHTPTTHDTTTTTQYPYNNGKKSLHQENQSIFITN